MRSVAAGISATRALHWTVKTNYRLRTISFALMFLSIALHVADKGYGPFAWGLIVVFLFIYPHLMYWRARHSGHPQQAEANNLAVDCLLFGFLVASLEFPLWISFTIYIASTLNITISRGARGALLSQLLFLVGAMAAVAVFGWRFSPDTAAPATLVCLLGQSFYMIAIGIAAFRRNRKLRETRSTLSEALANLQAAQAELVRQERLASLGALVAGVAHEINTPLGVCVTATSHLEEELQLALEARAQGALGDDQLEQLLDSASDAVRILKSNTQRAAKLIHSFKQVSVDQASGEQRTVNLAEYLNEVLATLRPNLKNKPVSVKISCPPNLIIETYPGALAQVITNLVMNSVIHAFDGRPEGTITITATREGDTLHLVYADDGNGTDEVGLKKLFDPFYTTRRGAGGVGLGAHIVYNLITGPLEGVVQVKSAPGEGMRFDIRVPMKLAGPRAGYGSPPAGA